MERKVRVFINHRFVGEIKINVDGYNLKIPILPIELDEMPKYIDVPLYRDKRNGVWFISIDSETYSKTKHFFERFNLYKNLLFYALTNR